MSGGASMRAGNFICLIAVVVACATVAVPARSQDFADYVGREQSRAKLPDSERRRLAAIYDEGVAAYQKKEYDRAVSAFTTLLQSNPEPKIAAVIYIARGIVLNTMGDPSNALKDFDVAVELDPRSIDAQRNRALAEGYLERRRPGTKQTTP